MRIESSKAPPPFTIERYAYDGDGTGRKRVDGAGRTGGCESGTPDAYEPAMRIPARPSGPASCGIHVERLTTHLVRIAVLLVVCHALGLLVPAPD